MQWNARGLQTKLPDIKMFLLKHPIPILAFGEAYSKEGFRLSGYTAFRSHDQGPARTILCIRNDLTCVWQQRVSGINADIVQCRVRLNSTVLTVVALYVPPSSSLAKHSLKRLFDSLEAPFVVVGDINAHHTSWGSRKTDSKGKIWAEFIEESDLRLLNDGSPTFLRRDFTTDALDVAICSKDIFSRLSWCTDVEARGSDHLPAYISCRGYGSRLRRSVTLVNWKEFRAVCRDVAHSAFSAVQLTEAITEAIRASSKEVCIPSGHLGTSPEVERLRACRRRAERKARRSGSLADVADARRLAGLVRRALKQLDRRRWRQFCESLSPFSSPAKVWRVARYLRDGHPPRNPLGSLAIATNTQELDVAFRFCEAVAAPSEAAGTASFRCHTDRLRAELLQIVPTTNTSLDAEFSLAELQTALRLSRARSSPGADGITYMALRNLSEVCHRSLLRVYNESWATGQVPDCWKVARVIPLLKPGKQPSLLASFRPVSLTSCIGKVLERMVLHRLEWWLEKQKIFPEEMSGFRRQRSSMDSVLDLVTAVEHAKSRRRLVVAVFLDVRRAYDTVSHPYVLQALQRATVSSRVFLWVADFLRGRKLFVRTRDGDTDAVDLPQGVPQGSVLSPVLFNLVMADLNRCAHRKVKVSLYADDVCIWTIGKSRPAIQRRLQRTLDSIAEYFARAGMDISSEKSVVLPFTRKRMSTFPLRIGDSTLSQVTRHRFLGVTLDRSLSWKPHITSLEAKAQKWINVIRHFAGSAWGCGQANLLAVHRALVRGTILYSLPVLHGISRASEQTLRCILARSLRVCLGVPRAAETRMVLAEARETPVEVLRQRETIRHYLRWVSSHHRHHLVPKVRARNRSNFCKLVATVKPLLPSFTARQLVSLSPPWMFPAPSVSCSLPGLRVRKAQASATELKQLTLTMMHDLYAEHRAIFTDGSTDREHSTAAFTIPSLLLSRAYRLSHRTSSTSAELHAILFCLSELPHSDPQHWVVYCDSKAALQCIALMGIRGTLAPVVWAVMREVTRLASEGQSIVFQWVPGHSGIQGNVAADRLAAAAYTTGPTVPIFLSRGDRRAFLSDLTAPLSHQQWCLDVPRDALMRKVDPDLAFHLPARVPRALASLLHRFRLGVAFTPLFRHRIGRSDTMFCTECGVLADVQHILIDCALYRTERAALCCRLRGITQAPLTLRLLLGPSASPLQQQQLLNAFHGFLKDTGLLQTL